MTLEETYTNLSSGTYSACDDEFTIEIAMVCSEEVQELMLPLRGIMIKLIF